MDDSLRTWQAFATAAGRGQAGGFAPIMEAAERFNAAARRYLQDIAASNDASSAPGTAARTFSHFLREQAARMGPPWAFDTATGEPPPAHLAAPPAMGITREHQQRIQRASDASRRMADAQARLQWLWFDTLTAAADAFSARIAGSAGAAADAATLRGLYDAWIDCAESAYAETVHGEAFCTALADFVNAGSAWRAETAAGLELTAKLWDLPTRSEIDSLNRRIAALETENQTRDKPRSGPKRATAARRGPRRPTP